MSSHAPPGYASGARESLPIGGLAAWAFATASLLVLSGYELVRALPALYLDRPARLAAELGGLASAVAGVAAGRRFRHAPCLPAALGAVALLVGGAAELAFTAFPLGDGLAAAVVALALAGAFSIGFAAGAGSATARVVAELGAVTWLLHPLRVALAAGAWLGLTASLPLLGALRRGGLLGALLALAALSLPRWAPLLGAEARFELRRLALPALAGLAGAAGLFLANERAPLADVARHAGEIAYVADGSRGRHVITRVQDGFAVFTDGLLVTTGNDAARYAESLAHPALAAAERRASVLVLGSTTGSLEREILRWRDVERVVSVATDARLPALAASSSWLRPLAAGALSDARVERVEAEAMAFVTREARRYDVVLADLGDPSSYRDGKHFTRFFFERLRERLAPGGVLGLPLTSPLRTPRTHAGIVRTLRAAGLHAALYRAPLPTLGEWGFAVAAADPSVVSGLPRGARPGFPAGTRFVTPQTLRSLFALPADAALAGAPVSYLFDQPVVDTYQAEEHALVE